MKTLFERMFHPFVFAADDGGGGGGDEVTMSKAESDQLRKKAAEGEKTSRKLQAELDTLKQKLEDAEVGDDELAKETKRADRAEAQLKTAKDSLSELEGEIESGKRQQTVSSVATRLQFRNPELASKLIGEDDQKDEASAEKALKALLKSEPYLKSKGTPQRDVTKPEKGDDDGDGSTQLEKNQELSGRSRLSAAYAEIGNNQEE